MQGRWGVWVIALVGQAFFVTVGQTQVHLPQIEVSAPSPFVRRPSTPRVVVRPQPGRSEQTTEAAPPPLPLSSPDHGVLPIVTDQFATVTVVPRDEIDRNPGRTLGDLLQQKPGITSSGFAPGAASRPIVRGLDNYRVRIQENGLASSGLSEIGEDHGVPIDPLAAQQVEVIRGPATLRFGSQAIGGVVNVENNRIPTAIPQRAVSGELRYGATTVDKGREGAVLLDAGGGPFALHADAFGRNAGDYKIPAYPYLTPDDPAPLVRHWQPNTAQRASGNSLGGSYVFDHGFIGVAVSHFESLYRIPGQEAAEARTRIDLNQTKISSKGEWRPDAAGIAAIRFWASTTDYKHAEIANENGFEGPQQRFLSNQKEARLEVQSLPFDLRIAALTSALGVQTTAEDLDAPGVLGGLFDPNTTRSLAFYSFNELRFGELFRLQLAGRIERNVVKGAVPDLHLGDTTVMARHREFTPKSGAIGLLHDLPADIVASVTGQYVERAPRAPELLSRGVHEATGTFDIGNPDLRTEAASSIEAGLRRSKGSWRFEATAFYTRFNGFIYRNLTGLQCEDSFASCAPDGDGDLKQAIYAQRDAVFRGAEFQTQLDIAPVLSGVWGIDAQYDIVRATFADGSNVPRIPPQRLGGGVYFRDGHWFMRVGLLHAFAQREISLHETPTGDYNLLKAEISYVTKLPGDPTGLTQLKFGISGDNLLNEDVRNAASFKKDEVLQPGRTIKLFANVKF